MKFKKLERKIIKKTPKTEKEVTKEKENYDGKKNRCIVGIGIYSR